MSVIEEATVIAPWVGPTTSSNFLTVVVLSSNVDIIEKISKALTDIHAQGNFRWKLTILRSFHLEEVVERSDLVGKVSIDFVILGLDTSRVFCLEWAKKVLMQVHPDLRSRRVILVNSSGLPPNSMAVNVGELVAFKSNFKLDMMTADVFKSDDARFLARRLLKYMEVSIGVKTGIPNLNV
ncbi:uncharacterized protein LOC134747742 [Cydia strobilella]|uniref:uncharacterized protein LOC134747742 n=1 Tax=Cydia strobilella TaxID=1100964 RepID=UPI0030040EEC